MTRAVLGVSVVLALVPAAAGAGASMPRPPVVLTATPSHLVLTGSARTAVRVTNSGTRRVVVDVTRAGFALDLRGRPRIVTRAVRSAVRWLTVRPAHFALGARSSASLTVVARLPRRAEPGDHDALVLLRTRPLAAARVAVRLRMGVVVVVRAPGRVVRRLELRGVHVARRRPRTRVLQVVVANLGNVTESLNRVRAVVSRTPTGRRVATLAAGRRDLRPGTRGLLEFPLTRRTQGRLTVSVVIPADAARRAVRRTYRIRVGW